MGTRGSEKSGDDGVQRDRPGPRTDSSGIPPMEGLDLSPMVRLIALQFLKVLLR